MSRQDPSSPVQFRRLRRFCRWTCRLVKVTVLLAIIVGIVYVIWTNHRGDKAARAMINQLAARGIPGESRPWVPDVDNGARFYLAAMKLLVLPKDLESKLPVVGWAEWPQFGEGFTEAQADVLREAAGRNTEALDLARAAQSMPRFSFEMNPVANQSRTLTELGQCRNLAKWLELHSLHSQAQSNGQGAADDCLAIFHISSSLKNEHYLVVFLVRMSINALASWMIEDLLSRCVIDEASLKALGTALHKASRSYNYAQVLRGELRTAVLILSDPTSALIQAECSQQQMAMVMLDAFSEYAGGDQESENRTLLAYSTGERIANSANHVIAALCPGQMQLAGAQTLSDPLNFFDQIADPTTDPQALLALSKRKTDQGDLFNALTSALENQLRAISTLTSAEVALEVELFRLRTGRWPSQVSEAVDTIPLDAYGHEIQMHSHDRGIRVYSIGANGVDENGRNRDDTGNLSDDEDDLTFRLLDLEERNQTPTITTVTGKSPDESLQDLLREFRAPRDRTDNSSND